MTVVVAGGGPVGMLAALLVKRRHAGARVVLVERHAALGGLYRSYRYKHDLVFDCGTHLYYDTGLDEVDRTVQELLPDGEWNILEGNRKDVAGVFFNGRLQTNSAYVDLRNLPETLRDRCVDEMTGNLPAPPPAGDAEAYLRWRFGETIASSFLSPVLARLYGHPPDELSVFATRLTAMDRVILFDDERMLEIMRSSEELRARLAYPEQLAFPGVRANTQRALYPRQGGMHRFVDACTRALEDAGVDIRLGHQISKVECERGRVERVRISSSDRTTSMSADEGGLHVFWACGVPALAMQLGVPLPLEQPVRSRRGVLVHLLFQRPLRIDDVYYFYVYDSGFLTFRVTCYAHYCPEMGRPGFPVTVELWPHSHDGMEAERWIQIALAELTRLGVLTGDNPHDVAQVEILQEGLPLPTVRNREALRGLRNAIAAVRPHNVDVIGGGAEDDLFFLNDMLSHMHGQLGRLDQ